MVVNDSRVMLITANVGSIFEDTEKTLKQWLRKCLKAVSRLSPMFVAIHCQEVGGKNYEASMHHVEHFVKTLLSSHALQEYDRVRMFLDEDFTAEDKFTALGSLYFVHESLDDVQIWDFKEHMFIPLQGKMVHSGNIENVTSMEKHKFPFGYFPERQWSRKGYIRTRWQVTNKKFDLVNIHLFHDTSNLTAIESSPSMYSSSRHDAFKYILNRLDNDGLETVPRFIFGDFNFRLDTCQLVQKRLENAQVNRKIAKKHGKLKRIQYTLANQVLLTVEPKLFDHHDHDTLFLGNFVDSFQEFDCEPKAFHDRLFEYPVRFPPSYPFSEDLSCGRSYMKTRCPSWCDRVLLTHGAQDLILSECDTRDVIYYVIGDKVCMGDHKPVFLSFNLKPAWRGATCKEDTAVIPGPYSPPPVTTLEARGGAEHQPLRRIISINGEPVTANELGTVSFLCNAKFKRTQALSAELLMRLDRKAFRDVAKGVLAMNSAVQRWQRSSSGSGRRRRHHSSSCESSHTDDCGSLSDTSTTASECLNKSVNWSPLLSAPATNRHSMADNEANDSGSLPSVSCHTPALS